MAVPVEAVRLVVFVALAAPKDCDTAAPRGCMKCASLIPAVTTSDPMTPMTQIADIQPVDRRVRDIRDRNMPGSSGRREEEGWTGSARAFCLNVLSRVQRRRSRLRRENYEPYASDSRISSDERHHRRPEKFSVLPRRHIDAAGRCWLSGSGSALRARGQCPAARAGRKENRCAMTVTGDGDGHAPGAQPTTTNISTAPATSDEMRRFTCDGLGRRSPVRRDESTS